VQLLIGEGPPNNILVYKSLSRAFEACSLQLHNSFVLRASRFYTLISLVESLEEAHLAKEKPLKDGPKERPWTTKGD